MKDGRTGPGNGAWEQSPVYGYPVGLLGYGLAFFGRFERMGLYFCHHVRMFFFSVIRRGAGVEHPKKVSLSPFGELYILTCN